jgi:hypothetical protein
MNIRLHNTLTRQKDIFVPADPQRVTMYVCGPTVYNYVHIGNARPVVVFDVLYRLLSRHFPQVIYARNITDVDDKINAAAAANGEPIRVLAERYAVAYREDMAQLSALPPTIEPWATEHIAQMIVLMKRRASSLQNVCAGKFWVTTHHNPEWLTCGVIIEHLNSGTCCGGRGVNPQARNGSTHRSSRVPTLFFSARSSSSSAYAKSHAEIPR